MSGSTLKKKKDRSEPHLPRYYSESVISMLRSIKVERVSSPLVCKLCASCEMLLRPSIPRAYKTRTRKTHMQRILTHTHVYAAIIQIYSNIQIHIHVHDILDNAFYPYPYVDTFAYSRSHAKDIIIICMYKKDSPVNVRA